MNKYILVNLSDLPDLDRKAHAMYGYSTRKEAIKARGKTNKLIVKATFNGGGLSYIRVLKA